MILTYYPLGDAFLVRSPESPLDDLPAMVRLAGKRPLVLQEVGYPTARRLQSSPAKQAAFVRAVYRAWAAAGSRIAFAPVDVVRSTSRDLASGLLQSTSNVRYFGSFRLPDGLEYVEEGQDVFSVVEGDPLSAEARSRWEIGIGRGPWQTRLVVESSMCADETTFHLQDKLEAFEGPTSVFSRQWNASIARDHI